MKYTRIFLLCFFAFLANQATAQKFGFIETERIVAKMPEYKEVQTELEKYGENWKKRLETLKKELDKMNGEYQVDEVLLTPEMQKTRKKAIFDKEEELNQSPRKNFWL